MAVESTPPYHSAHHCIVIHFTHTIEVGGTSEESGKEAKLVLMVFHHVDT